MDAGEYLPKKSEQPLYTVFFCKDGSGGICTAALQTKKEQIGEAARSKLWN
jgi:hypothetical protein